MHGFGRCDFAFEAFDQSNLRRGLIETRDRVSLRLTSTDPYHHLVVNEEEQQREPLEIGGKVLFYPDFALRTAGGDVSVAAPWKSYVLQDRELISGQNPFSDEALLKLLIPALNGKKK